MNIDISEIDNGGADSAPTSGSPKDRKSRGGLFMLAFLALLVAAAALAGSGWLWWQDRASAQQDQALQSELSQLEMSTGELSRKVQALDQGVQSLSAGDRSEQLTEMNEQLASERKRLGEVERALQEQLTLTRSLQAASESSHNRLVAAESALAELSRRELDAPGELDVAEVDYLLRLASERLALFADPEAADRALALADSHLAVMDNPAYLVVRQEIAAARRQLAAADMPDSVAIAARLDAAQESIPRLAFRGGEVVAASSAEGGETAWWEKLKSTLAGLVTIRRSTAEENLEISLEDKDFVRQRLWMQLESAHLSLLRRDEDAFSAALSRAQKTVSTWFDPDSGAVQDFEQTLARLAQTDLRAEMPDISTPWSTLRMLRSGRAAAPPPPGAGTPAESGKRASPEDDTAGGDSG